MGGKLCGRERVQAPPLWPSRHPQQRFGQVASDPFQPRDACAETEVPRLLGILTPSQAAPEVRSSAELSPLRPVSGLLGSQDLCPLSVPALAHTPWHILSSNLKGTAGLPSWMASSRVAHALGSPAVACTSLVASEGRGETGTRGMRASAPWGAWPPCLILHHQRAAHFLSLPSAG